MVVCCGGGYIGVVDVRCWIGGFVDIVCCYWFCGVWWLVFWIWWFWWNMGLFEGGGF